MICASWTFWSHFSPCQALAEALEQNSALKVLDLNTFGIDSEIHEARCFRWRGICSAWSSGPRSPKAQLAEYFRNRPQRDIADLQKHVMQRPSKVFMIQFPASTWEMDKFGSIFSMERYECMIFIHFQAGDHSPRFQKYNAHQCPQFGWNVKIKLFLTGPPRPNLVVSDSPTYLLFP